MNSQPVSTRDLLPAERRLVSAMQGLGFGRFQCLRIENGALVLDPWPTTVRDVKFCGKASQPDAAAEDFLLKQQVVELFEYVRSVDAGEIRTLEIRHGLPFSMEVELARARTTAAEGGRRG